jgi:hypothetical protein
MCVGNDNSANKVCTNIDPEKDIKINDELIKEIVKKVISRL